MLNINELIKSSMKSGDKVALRAYKNLKAEIQIVKTAKNARPYNDTTEIKIISKMCKKLEDAILDFSKAHREDLVADYTSELEVLKKLLPEPVNESQICSFIESYCAKIGLMDHYGISAEIPKNRMSEVMKEIRNKYPQSCGKMVTEIVKKYVV